MNLLHVGVADRSYPILHVLYTGCITQIQENLLQHQVSAGDLDLPPGKGPSSQQLVLVVLVVVGGGVVGEVEGVGFVPSHTVCSLILTRTDHIRPRAPWLHKHERG